MSDEAGMRMSSKNSSVVAWLIIVLMGLIVSPGRSRMSMRNSDSPSDFFCT